MREKNIAGGAFEFALCPRCHSSFRERLMYLYLKNRTTMFQEAHRVLHIAPERNLQKALRELSNLSYVSADLDSPLAAVKIDITNIAYGDNVFDVIICNHVLEHVPDDRKAMSELLRVLKPGGWAILQVPISLSSANTYEESAVLPKDREKVFGQCDHVRIYETDYKDRLTLIGFSVQVYNFTDEFGEVTSCRYGLQAKEDLYICVKYADSPSPDKPSER
ncbi:MAG: methyltransferase domain-containing protein [Dehalococcoidia bacterium]|nr:methyltransferase domain-containing protein [Dehalococcoidia bacterium]